MNFTFANLDIDCSLANRWIAVCVIVAIVAASVAIDRIASSRRSRRVRFWLVAAAVLAVLLSPGLGVWLSVFVSGQWSHMTRSTQIGCISESRIGPWHLILPWAGLFVLFEFALRRRRRARRATP